MPCLIWLTFLGQNLDEAHSSPGLHAAAGPGLAEQCATLVHNSFLLYFLDQSL